MTRVIKSLSSMTDIRFCVIARCRRIAAGNNPKWGFISMKGMHKASIATLIRNGIFTFCVMRFCTIKNGTRPRMMRWSFCPNSIEHKSVVDNMNAARRVCCTSIGMFLTRLNKYAVVVPDRMMSNNV